MRCSSFIQNCGAGSRIAHDSRAAATPKIIGNVLPKPEGVQNRPATSATGRDHVSTSGRPAASFDSDAAEHVTISALLHDTSDARQTAHPEAMDRKPTGALTECAVGTSVARLAGSLGSVEGVSEGDIRQERESSTGGGSRTSGEVRTGGELRTGGESTSGRRRLTEEQREAQRLLRMVLRFDDTTYRLGGRRDTCYLSIAVFKGAASSSNAGCQL